MAQSHFISPHLIRAKFSQAMSDMYQREVPLYGHLLKVVAKVNQSYINAHPEIASTLGDLSRISCEKHGAIRLGTASEMHNMARLFAVMDMYPVGYYNLTVANIPVHSTAFRPITEEGLSKNPFRIFCSLLRLDLLDEEIRLEAEKQLSKRHIFSTEVLSLIDIAETQGGLTQKQANAFISSALETFKWHKQAAVSKCLYERLLQENGLVADIVGFKGPHINHLTPRTLDIDALHKQLKSEGVAMIPAIQGPPTRHCDILLRQTSFQALSEQVSFTGTEAEEHQGAHRARFGEIEQRGIALTPKGRTLYDTLLQKALKQTNEKEPDYKALLSNIFSAFPDSYEEMHKQQLAYFTYHIAIDNKLDIKQLNKLHDIDDLLDKGIIEIKPIIYEDFLPVSAAGIFKSNLVEGGESQITSSQDHEKSLSEAIGREPLDPFKLYEKQQHDSLRNCSNILGKKLI